MFVTTYTRSFIQMKNNVCISQDTVKFNEDMIMGSKGITLATISSSRFLWFSQESFLISLSAAFI